MPEMSGVEFAIAITKMYPVTKILLFSGQGESQKSSSNRRRRDSNSHYWQNRFIQRSLLKAQKPEGRLINVSQSRSPTISGRRVPRNRCGSSTIMRYYIQPVVKRLGIKKRVTWHTFRRTYTTLLSCQWGRREGGAGVVATQLVTHHDGHLRPSSDARETSSTTESGGDGPVGENRTGGQKDGLTAPQNAPRRKQGIPRKLFILLAFAPLRHC